MAIHIIKEVPFLKLLCPALELCASNSMQVAVQRAVVAPAPAPAPAPAEDFDEQTVQESNQHWAAVST